jgi:hypothetical protein
MAAALSPSCGALRLEPCVKSPSRAPLKFPARGTTDPNAKRRGRLLLPNTARISVVVSSVGIERSEELRLDVNGQPVQGVFSAINRLIVAEKDGQSKGVILFQSGFYSGGEGPTIRFSLTPDGKSITYATAVTKSNLWILEGFRQPGLLSRLGLNWSR